MLYTPADSVLIGRIKVLIPWREGHLLRGRVRHMRWLRLRWLHLMLCSIQTKGQIVDRKAANNDRNADDLLLIRLAWSWMIVWGYLLSP